MSDANAGASFTPRVFSGIQPSGGLTLGNYLGALKKFARLQHEHDCLFCIVDLHAITVPQEPGRLADQTRHIAAAFFAAGVEPDKALVYAQSSVPAHTASSPSMPETVSRISPSSAMPSALLCTERLS